MNFISLLIRFLWQADELPYLDNIRKLTDISVNRIYTQKPRPGQGFEYSGMEGILFAVYRI